MQKKTSEISQSTVNKESIKDDEKTSKFSQFLLGNSEKTFY